MPRCHACGAALAPAATWCSLCFAATVPGPDAVSLGAGVGAAAANSAGVADSGGALGTADRAGPLGGSSDATWPCLDCGHHNEFAADACAECGAGFLSAATQRPQLELPVVGDVFALSRPHQFVLFGFVGVILLVVLLGVMAMLGAIV